jgi:hypothetical protein
MLAGNTAYELYTTTLAYDSIASAAPSGTGVVTFSSIPSTYSSLKIIVTSQSNYTAYNTNCLITFNGDSTPLYGDKAIFTANEESPYFYSNNGRNYMDLCNGVQNGTYMTSGWAVGEIDIPNYAATDVYKSAQAIWATNAMSYPAAYMSNASGYWKSTDAINSITLTTSSGGGNYVTGSRFSLFGVK